MSKLTEAPWPGHRWTKEEMEAEMKAQRKVKSSSYFHALDQYLRSKGLALNDKELYEVCKKVYSLDRQ